MLQTNGQRPVEVFASFPLMHDPEASTEENLCGLVLRQNLKTFLLDRNERLRGVYDESSPRDSKRLKLDIHLMQTEH